MRVKVLGRCRGNGKLYLLLRITGLGSSSLTVASELDDGTALPSYFVETEQDLGATEGVLVLFGARVKQHVTFRAQTGQAASLIIRPRLVSIASKYNGVFRKALCSDIRNIDSRGIVSGVSISCDLLVPTPNSVIVKGQYSTKPGSHAPIVRVHDARGRLVDAPCVICPNVKDSSNLESGASSGTYSVELDTFDETVSLSLWVDDDPVGSCYVLRQFHRKQLLKRSDRHFESAFSQPGYDGWLMRHRASADTIAEQSDVQFAHAPLFSVIVPLYKTPLSFFREMADSVLAQSYANWELILVNSTPEERELSDLVSRYEAADSRVRVVTLEKNYGITENTNRGIAAARGDYLCFFDHDDVLEPDILFEYAKAISDNPAINLLYCDEDKLFPDGNFGNPTFKPDFSVDMVRDNNYICHLLTVKRSAYDSIEPSGPELDGAQDHAMVLKIAELGGPIHHVPKILYHWRISETSTAGNSDSKPYATTAGILAVQQHLDRVGVSGTVECSHGRAFRYLVKYPTPERTTVSVIAATRGDYSVGMLLDALSSSVCFGVELVLVAPSSRIEAVENEVRNYSEKVSARVIGVDGTFSISAWLNIGAKASTGDVLVMCHDDIRPVDSDWLDVLVGHALRIEVGAVGTMTVSRDGLIQQAGLALVDGSIVNLSAGVYRESPGYIYFPLTTRNVSAVSGVCLATRRDIFEMVGGLDERLTQSFVDVDYCLRVQQCGELVVYTPEAALYHDARTDGGGAGLGARSPQHYADKAMLMSRWAEVFSSGDPYFNPNFSCNPVDAAQYRFDECGVANEAAR